jgi:hypothetical protein
MRHARSASLGPRGLLHLGDVVATRPQLLDFLVGALPLERRGLRRGSQRAAATALPAERGDQQNTARAAAALHDRKTSSFIMMLLLGFGASRVGSGLAEGGRPRTRGAASTGRANARQIGDRPAAARSHRRAARRHGTRACAPPALETLLAKTGTESRHAAAPLEEFAATAEAAVATRIREALSAPR